MLIVRLVKRKREQAGQSGKKRKFIRGKREGDWLLRRTSILPFWWSPSYTPPVKNSLKGWSHSRRSRTWWSRSFEKIGAREITGCHLGNLVSLTDHCDLFFVCQVDITSRLINETPSGPYQIWFLTWTNSFLPWIFSSWFLCHLRVSVTTGIVPGTGRRRILGPGKSPNARSQLVLCQGSGHCHSHVPSTL